MKIIYLYVLVLLFIFSPQAIFAQESTSTLIGNSTEEKIRNFFSDIPVMIEIARCESGFRQFNNSGSVLRGGAGGSMVGVFQFYEAGHTVPAQNLGYDITTLEGNVRYAKVLYTKEGTAPWISSFTCWNTSSTNSTPTNTEAGILTKDLSLGMVDPQVLELQKLLNKAGYTLAASGPGSPGNETTMFGALTKAALKSFQCAKNIACSGDEYSTGYGFANSKTRTALVEAANSSSNNTSTNTPDIESLKAKLAELLALVAKLQAELVAMNTVR